MTVCVTFQLSLSKDQRHKKQITHFLIIAIKLWSIGSNSQFKGQHLDFLHAHFNVRFSQTGNVVKMPAVT